MISSPTLQTYKDPVRYLAIGVCLQGLATEKQLKFAHELAGKIDQCARNFDGYLSTVDFTRNYLQLTVFAWDIEEAQAKFILSVMRGELILTTSDKKILDYKYAVVGLGDPSSFMSRMIDSIEGEACPCMDCSWAMVEKQALLSNPPKKKVPKRKPTGTKRKAT